MAQIIYKELSYNIIGCAIEVHKRLGVGFLESVYEEAFKIELKLCIIINFGDNSLKYERVLL